MVPGMQGLETVSVKYLTHLVLSQDTIPYENRHIKSWKPLITFRSSDSSRFGVGNSHLTLFIDIYFEVSQRISFIRCEVGVPFLRGQVSSPSFSRFWWEMKRIWAKHQEERELGAHSGLVNENSAEVYIFPHDPNPVLRRTKRR